MQEKRRKDEDSVTIDLEKGIVDSPELEQMWWKLPGKKPVIASKEGSRKYDSVIADYDTMRKFEGTKAYNIHTHPRTGRSNEKSVGIPGVDDWKESFLKKKYKTMIIAQNSPSGEIEGYTFVRKGKNTEKKIMDAKKASRKPQDYLFEKSNRLRKMGNESLDDAEFSEYKNLMKRAKKNQLSEKELERLAELHGKSKKQEGFYGLASDIVDISNKPYAKISDLEQDINSYKQNPQDLERFAKKYGLSFKFVPVEGYEFNRELGTFTKKKSSGLEKTVEVFLWGSLCIALFLKFPEITGLAINTDLSSNFSNYLSLIIFLILISLLFYYYITKISKRYFQNKNNK